MLRIKKCSDLVKWLNDNFCFQDGYVSDIKKIDKRTVRMCIGIPVEGNYVAGTPKVLKEYTIIAKGVRNFKNNFQYYPDHCIQGLFDIETTNGIGIEVDLPEIMKIYCKELWVEEPRYIRTINKPWISERELYAKVPDSEIPKPITWIEQLEAKGFRVSWRYGGSEIKLPEQVPYPDYSGWFLQETNKIQNTQFGIFISHIHPKYNGFGISFEKHYGAENDLWIALTQVIAEFPDVEIHTGNCRLTGKQWINYLNSGELPY
ncbi:hypothetical protein [Bacillus sp. AFS096315]|uniref:hypothetical protein n=1 Tax=Bacillus sp. AFS096315 TaxID=2033517 RepID=UPI000BEE4D46|nr:hypothetical protein [Bacillus sp. AFS096315]PEC48587.1 hypothetical protein CON00_13425 [Bacillus sp. AFS096315]